MQTRISFTRGSVFVTFLKYKITRWRRVFACFELRSFILFRYVSRDSWPNRPKRTRATGYLQAVRAGIKDGCRSRSVFEKAWEKNKKIKKLRFYRTAATRRDFDTPHSYGRPPLPCSRRVSRFFHGHLRFPSPSSSFPFLFLAYPRPDSARFRFGGPKIIIVMRHNRRPEVTNICWVVCSPNRLSPSSAPNGFLIALRRYRKRPPSLSPTPRITALSMSFYRSCEKPLRSLRSSTSLYRPVPVKENRQTSRPTTSSVEMAPKTIRTKRVSSGCRFFALGGSTNSIPLLRSSVADTRLTTSSECTQFGGCFFYYSYRMSKLNSLTTVFTRANTLLSVVQRIIVYR